MRQELALRGQHIYSFPDVFVLGGLDETLQHSAWHRVSVQYMAANIIYALWRLNCRNLSVMLRHAGQECT